MLKCMLEMRQRQRHFLPICKILHNKIMYNFIYYWYLFFNFTETPKVCLTFTIWREQGEAFWWIPLLLLGGSQPQTWTPNFVDIDHFETSPLCEGHVHAWNFTQMYHSCGLHHFMWNIWRHWRRVSFCC